MSIEENEINHEAWCNNLAAKLLCIFVLDRFGDFVSDQVFKHIPPTVGCEILTKILFSSLGRGTCSGDRLANSRFSPTSHAEALCITCTLHLIADDQTGVHAEIRSVW